MIFEKTELTEFLSKNKGNSLSYILGDKKSREPILGNLVGNCYSESLVVSH
jgi:hypothetical protein